MTVNGIKQNYKPNNTELSPYISYYTIDKHNHKYSFLIHIMPSKFDKNKKNSDAFVFTTDFDKQMFSNLNIEPSKSYLKLGSTITKQKFNDIPKKILQNKSGLIEFIYLFNNCYIYSVVFVK